MAKATREINSVYLFQPSGHRSGIKINSKHAAIPDDFTMDLPSFRNGTEDEIYWSLSSSHSAVS